MIRIFCTKKLGNKLKKKPVAFQGSMEPLDRWCAHIVRVDEYVDVVVVMCADNRFGFFMWNLQRCHFYMLDKLIQQGIHDTLEFYGVEEKILEDYLYQVPELCEGITRKEVAILNQIGKRISALAEEVDINEWLPIKYISMLNNTKADVSKTEQFIPGKRMLEGLKERYQKPVLLQQAYKIVANLFIGRRVTQRIIQIPRTASFENLHLALQTVFGWRSNYLYEFTVRNLRISNNPEDYYYYDDDDYEMQKQVDGEAIQLCTVLRKETFFEYYFTVDDFQDGWGLELHVLEEDVPYEYEYPTCVQVLGGAPPVNPSDGDFDYLDYRGGSTRDGDWWSQEPDMDAMNLFMKNHMVWQ